MIMKIYKFLFALSFIVLFTSCNNNEPKFIKTWESVRVAFPYKAYLKINKDYTFNFNGGACLSRFYSKGKWKEKNDTIILNSIVPSKCLYTMEFGINCVKFNADNNLYRETTIKNCEPNNGEEYVNFKNEKFYIKSDTLKFIAKQKNCPTRNDFFLKK